MTMSHNILLTSSSGYPSGTLLARLNNAQLPSYRKFLALVRTLEQAGAVKQYSATPLTINALNPEGKRSFLILLLLIIRRGSLLVLLIFRK